LARAARVADVASGTIRSLPIVRLIVGIERFLLRPQVLRNVLEVHADSRPRVKPSTHGIHEYVGRLKMPRRVGVPRFPTL
jgi:hypothetical protein